MQSLFQLAQHQRLKLSEHGLEPLIGEGNNVFDAGLPGGDRLVTKKAPLALQEQETVELLHRTAPGYKQAGVMRTDS